MGNGVSCVSAGGAAEAKLLGPEGNFQAIETPAGAAEIMIQFPGHVVALAEEVARTRRAAALRANEELQPGAAYLLLPLERVGSRLSDQKMEVLLNALSSGGGRRRQRVPGKWGCGVGRRVFPRVAGGEERKVARLGGELSGFSGKTVGGGCRQWRPALAPIPECKSN